MIKKIITLLVLIIIFCTACTKKTERQVNTFDEIIKRGYINVGVKTDSFPFGYKDSKGNYAGFDVDLAKIIAGEIFKDKSRVKFVPVTSSDRMMKLFSEDIDFIIATMSITTAREQILDFSNSYHNAGQSILVRSGSKIKGLRDLNNKKVIIVFGSTSERSLRSAVPSALIVGYKNYKDAYKALKAGKADAIVSDDSILLGFSLKDSGVKLLPKRYTKEPYAIAFRKGAESKELIKIINEILDNQRHKGVLKNLRKQYGIK
ncbi:transporter substrate-binding domain-containing protein [bacterium]|nr:transporter substrate-binding domain-containing protein [bacterium]